MSSSGELTSKKISYPHFNKFTLGLCNSSAGVEFMLSRSVSCSFGVSIANNTATVEGRYYFEVPKKENNKDFKPFTFLRGSTRNNVALGFGIYETYAIFNPKAGITYNSNSGLTKPFISLEFNF